MTLSDEQIDRLLERFDQTAPELQRRIIARFASEAVILQDVRKDLKTLHQRKCWGCDKTHWHADSVTPYVLCPECGSQDTRRCRTEAQ